MAASETFCARDVINPFLDNVSFSYPLKTPENRSLFGVFRGYKLETLARIGLRILEFLLKILTLFVFNEKLKKMLSSTIYLIPMFNGQSFLTDSLDVTV